MSNRAPGFGDVSDPFGQVDTDVEDRYVPPTNLAAWEREGPAPTTTATSNTAIELEHIQDDEPFTAAHLAAATQSAVPAVSASSLPPTFTASVPAAHRNTASGKMGPSPVPSSVPTVGVSNPDTTRLLSQALASSSATPIGHSPPDLPSEDPLSHPFYSIKRYRAYFNVDTDEVLNRIFRAVALFFKGDFLNHIGSKPDLYGPFWIASTLVFVSAAAGNTASYIAYHRSFPGGAASPPSPPGDPSSSPSHARGWYYDVDKVGGSMGLFYGYIGILGILLWAVLKFGYKSSIGLAHIWCGYGYALAAYIPMAALCVLPMEAVRWSLVGVATATSGLFLVLNFKSVIIEAAGTQAVPLLLVMMGVHAVLGLALKLFFFHYSA